MQHPSGHAGKAPNGRGIVQVAHQRTHADPAQGFYPGGGGCEGQHLQPPRTGARVQVARYALANVAAAHDQKAFAAKARWQGAEGILV